MNHRHVLDAVCDAGIDGEFEDEELIFISKVYAAVLRDLLRVEFPDISFVVKVSGEDTVAIYPLDLIVTYHRADASL